MELLLWLFAVIFLFCSFCLWVNGVALDYVVAAIPLSLMLAMFLFVVIEIVRNL